jgi:hypothetical protein
MTSGAWVLLLDVLAVYFTVGPQEMPWKPLRAIKMVTALKVL